MRKGILSAVLLATVIVLGSWALSSAIPEKGPSGISAVKAMLPQNCALAGCHRTNFPAANLRLDTGRFPTSVLDVKSGQLPDRKLVDTKAPERSYFLAKIRGETGIAGGRMPLNRAPLSDQQIQEVEAWIKSLKSE
jgi:mono/diheme cytochrome c family protein